MAYGRKPKNPSVRGMVPQNKQPKRLGTNRPILGGRLVNSGVQGPENPQFPQMTRPGSILATNNQDPSPQAGGGGSCMTDLDCTAPGARCENGQCTYTGRSRGIVQENDPFPKPPYWS